MKKHRVISVVLAIVNLILALFLWINFNFAWGPNLPSLTQKQNEAERLLSSLNINFLSFLLAVSFAFVIGIIIKRNWGRTLALTQCIFFVSFSVYCLALVFSPSVQANFPLTFFLSHRILGVGIFCIVYSITEWIYLTPRSVKAIYKSTTK
jgi:hypothetical protein